MRKKPGSDAACSPAPLRHSSMEPDGSALLRFQTNVQRMLWRSSMGTNAWKNFWEGDDGGMV